MPIIIILNKKSDKIKHEGKSFSARNYYIFVPSKIDNGTVLIMSFPWRKPVFISTQTLTHAVFSRNQWQLSHDSISCILTNQIRLRVSNFEIFINRMNEIYFWICDFAIKIKLNNQWFVFMPNYAGLFIKGYTRLVSQK